MSWLALGPLALILHLAVFSTYIALQRRKPTATLAWILLVAVLPIIGLFVWALFGGYRIRRQRTLRRGVVSQVKPLWLRPGRHGEGVPGHDLSLSSQHMIALGQADGLGAPAYPGNHVELFLQPALLYDAIDAAIRAAEHHVHLQYYIFKNDEAGHRLRAALIERARAGVKVRCLFDGLGSFGLGDEFLKPMLAAGVEVAWFLPLRLPGLSKAHPWFSHLRNHRKIVVIDGVKAFTGGVNIGDEYAGYGDHPGWRDTHLVLAGPAVRALQELFLEDWMFATDVDIESSLVIEDLFHEPEQPPGSDVVQIIGSGPDTQWDLIHKLYFQAIVEARERVFLTTPYFIPDQAIFTALTTAALRGVDVQLLLPARSDVRLAEWAARSYYAELLEAGVQIHEFTGTMLHAKTLVVDGEICSVGSANMDIRSFELNFEANAFVYCQHLAEQLEQAFVEDVAQSKRVEHAAFNDRHIVKRIAEGWARLLSPIL